MADPSLEQIFIEHVGQIDTSERTLAPEGGARMNGWRTLFPNAWYISVREFRSRVQEPELRHRHRLLAVIAFAATQLPVLIDFAMSTSQTRVEVVVQRRRSAVRLAWRCRQRSSTGRTRPRHQQPFVLTWLPGDDLAAAQQALEQGKFDALLIVDRDPTSQRPRVHAPHRHRLGRRRS